MIQISEDQSFSSLKNYLTVKGWVKKEELITKITKAGEGNMNVVLRVTTNMRSIILKQSQPFVQKYQDIPAPIERIEVEKQFYEAISTGTIKENIPTILGFDNEAYILALQDLGDCDDMSFIYKQRSITTHQLKKLIDISHHVHTTKPSANFPQNIKMRELNHQHIFKLPFMKDNGFSLDTIQPGLQNISTFYKNNIALKKQVAIIGEKYLSNGNTLLHGDFYPGSWISQANNLFVIDPEFGFVGFAEFDIGVMAAHLIIATHDITYVEKIEHLYPSPLDAPLVKKVAGIEIMRRLIGLAQLPLKRNLAEKQELLNMAYKMIIQ